MPRKSKGRTLCPFTLNGPGELPLPTQTRPWRFRSRMASVLYKPPFTEVVEKGRIRCQGSLQGIYGDVRTLQLSGRIYNQGRCAIDPRTDVNVFRRRTLIETM